MMVCLEQRKQEREFRKTQKKLREKTCESYHRVFDSIAEKTGGADHWGIFNNKPAYYLSDVNLHDVACAMQYVMTDLPYDEKRAVDDFEFLGQTYRMKMSFEHRKLRDLAKDAAPGRTQEERDQVRIASRARKTRMYYENDSIKAVEVCDEILNKTHISTQDRMALMSEELEYLELVTRPFEEEKPPKKKTNIFQHLFL